MEGNKKRIVDTDTLTVAIKYVTKHAANSGSEWMEGYIAGLNAVKEMILEAPAVDAVEVVRCEDCEHWEDGYMGICYKCKIMTEYDHFCKYGERRSNGKQ